MLHTRPQRVRGQNNKAEASSANIIKAVGWFVDSQCVLSPPAGCMCGGQNRASA